ncbi:uncharacterized protein LOC123517302 [Portunus trituberculatus]|uniref:uncharacterized protein LOC123517302 n=1 Tax=Portunus trituberculatus TaxID=210409 RepID=UPI001E1CE727|nr:uncharacterized protein LOC123517302 [Portunus trituberculatus]
MKWLVVGIMMVSLFGAAHGRDYNDGRIVAVKTTKTAFILTTTTIGTPYTCYAAENQVVCQRRRLRRYSSLPDQIDASNHPMLDGSLIENSEMEGKREREKRLSFTLWVTTSSTFTITSTSINSATTFSLSFYCTVSNASFPPRC